MRLLTLEHAAQGRLVVVVVVVVVSPKVHLALPTPWPWNSSVLVRYGAISLPGPLRRSSAHVAAMSGAVAAAFERLPLRCRLP